MNPLTTLVRLLGNEGAVTNARRALEVTARHDWLVQGLAHRLDQHDATRAVPAATGATATAASAA